MREQQLLGSSRLLQVIIAGFWLAFGAVMAWQVPGDGKIGVVAIAAVFALVTVVAFELRRRSLRKTLARVREEVTAIARSDLDAAADVKEDAPMVASLASNPQVARMFATRGIRYFVAGTWKGAAVEIGTNVIPSRDTDTRISYVVAGPAAALPPFRAIMRGTFTTVSRLGMSTNEVRTNDAAFDAKWVVDGDAALVTRVLDDAMRARLLQLFEALRWNMAHTASIEAMSQGVIVRWPGELDARFASSLRDLAFDVRDRLATP